MRAMQKKEKEKNMKNKNHYSTNINGHKFLAQLTIYCNALYCSNKNRDFKDSTKHTRACSELHGAIITFIWPHYLISMNSKVSIWITKITHHSAFHSTVRWLISRFFWHNYGKREKEEKMTFKKLNKVFKTIAFVYPSAVQQIVQFIQKCISYDTKFQQIFQHPHKHISHTK